MIRDPLQPLKRLAKFTRSLRDGKIIRIRSSNLLRATFNEATRGVPSDRVVVIDAGHREDVATQLRIVPEGMQLLKPLPGITLKDFSIHKCVDKVFARVYYPNRK